MKLIQDKTVNGGGSSSMKFTFIRNKSDDNVQAVGRLNFVSKIFTGKVRIVLAIFAVALLSAGIYSMFHKPVAVVHYIYPRLEDYTLEGSSKGEAMTFQKPVVFIQSAIGKGVVHFTQTGAYQDKVAYMAASTVKNPSVYSDNDIDVINSYIGNNDNTYPMGNFVEKFIKQTLPSSWDLTIDKPVVYKNVKFKDVSWQYNFTAADPSKKSPIFGGRVIIQVSPKATYYFLLSTRNDNWRNNAKTWNGIFDSIKVGQ